MKVNKIMNSSLGISLNDLITYIEERPQINVVGVLQALEPLIKPGEKDLLETGVELPEVYLELRAYYNRLSESFKSRETTTPNQVGLLQTLKEIKRRYF